MSDPLSVKLKISWKALLSNDKEYGSFLYHTENLPDIEFISEAIDEMKDRAVRSLKKVISEDVDRNLKIKKMTITIEKMTITIEGHHSIVEEFIGTNPS